jgi:hypothetical protein
MAVLVTVFGVVLALLAVLVAGLLRSHAEILRSLYDLGVDLDPDAGVQPRAVASITVPRPRTESRFGADLVGVTPSGDAVSIAVLGAKHPTLVSFLTSGCTTCLDFWNAFSQPSLAVPGGARLVVVTKGEEAESPHRLRKFTPVDVPVVMSTAAWEQYDVPVAPYFAFVDGPSGQVVGEGAAASWGQVASMLEQALTDAGLDARPKRRGPAGGRGQDRAARVDRDLAAAGIDPGHESLYPASGRDLHDTSDSP